MYIQIEHHNQLHLPLFNSFDDFIEQLNELLGENSYIIEKNGRQIDVNVDHSVDDDQTYKIWPKVLGGKGGFGSLLRSFGKQILISKNKEACRDLNGRRMRDVNNEKKLKEWMQKQLEKPSSSSAESKSATAAAEDTKDYRNVPPPHKFSDSAYDEQKKQIAEDIDEAVQIAAELIQNEKLKKKKKSTTAVSTNDDDDNEKDDVETTSKKRRHSDETLEEGEVKNKKKSKPTKGVNAAFFLGIDLGDVSSDDDELEVDQGTKKKVIQKS